MAISRYRPFLILAAALTVGCASAEDRLNEGIALQSQGRYVQAVYRYADALEKDSELVQARERMLAAGDSAVMVAMDDADDVERRGDPVAAANRYLEIDRMLSRIRQVGSRPILPPDYATIRRAIFDRAIDWQMVRGDEAAEDGRWEDARGYYVNARNHYLPSRAQVDASYEAETRILLDWAWVELHDGRPRTAWGRAQEALEVRESPARETVLSVRDIQEQALASGTVVLAVVPVMADPGVREWLGGEFEIALDRDLGLDHWTRPPLFVEMADPLLLRSELRGLLRGRALQSPMLVGRALELIGADLGAMIRVASIEVTEEEVTQDLHQSVVERGGRRLIGGGSGWSFSKGEASLGMTADGRQEDPDRGSNGRGPPDEGNNGRGPRDDDPGDRGVCGKGNNGRGPPDAGNNGRGPDRGGDTCPDEPTEGEDDATTPPTEDPDPATPDGDTGTSGTGDPVTPDDDRVRPGDPSVYPRDRRGGLPSTGGRTRPMTPSVPGADTVTYAIVRGTLVYHVTAEIVLVDAGGREVNRLVATSTQQSPFERGAFDGDPRLLRLPAGHERYFDPNALAAQQAEIEGAVLADLAAAIAVGTYDQVLAVIP